MPSLPLPVARYRFELRVKRWLRLPRYAASTLRGAWGRALRELSCMTRQPTCDGCQLINVCHYAMLFETSNPTKVLGRHALTQLPKPYVIEPLEETKPIYAPGDFYTFRMVLIGQALDRLPLILDAYMQALRFGIGDGEAAVLDRVVLEGTREIVVFEGQEGKIIPHDVDIPPPSIHGPLVNLRLLTPLRLQSNAHRIHPEEHTARRLLMALVRRISLLCASYSGNQLDLDYVRLAQLAEQIRSRKSLRWQEWSRYSNRQQQRINLGGYIGNWTLIGDLSDFIPFIHLGQWVHVGKQTTFGLGRYVVSSD